ncbi:MAG TPA: hypothetical protein VFD74_00580 [Thermoleophilia bacterium]|nr:hypothetical protein [Thermoleophilia bacterium]
MVEAEWLDRYVLLLAEYGALLRMRRFEVRPADDDHSLAWSRIFRDGQEVESEKTAALLADDEEAGVHRNVCRQLLGGLRAWTLGDPGQADFFWAGKGPFDRTPSFFRRQRRSLRTSRKRSED